MVVYVYTNKNWNCAFATKYCLFKQLFIISVVYSVYKVTVEEFHPSNWIDIYHLRVKQLVKPGKEGDKDPVPL